MRVKIKAFIYDTAILLLGLLGNDPFPNVISFQCYKVISPKAALHTCLKQTAICSTPCVWQFLSERLHDCGALFEFRSCKLESVPIKSFETFTALRNQHDCLSQSIVITLFLKQILHNFHSTMLVEKIHPVQCTQDMFYKKLNHPDFLNSRTLFESSSYSFP